MERECDIEGQPGIIGVVGGLGPYAGLDLVRKIFDATPAQRDQDHLPVALLSLPSRFADRTAFLQGRAQENPGHAIAEVALSLAAQGAVCVGVPCNTAHAPAIFSVVERRMAAEANGRCELVHMVREVGRAIGERFPSARCVGILSTTGTREANIYPARLDPLGFTTLQPSARIQERLVHPAVYDAAYGIKSTADPVSARAVADLEAGVRHLADAGAEVVVLACTEIPLALHEPAVDGIPLLDATDVLARALVARSMAMGDQLEAPEEA